MQEKIILIDKFSGVRNVAPDSAEQSELQAATNMYVTNQQSLRRRPGQELVYTGSVHSLWSYNGVVLFRSGTGLYVTDSSFSPTLVASNFVSSGRTYYVGLGDRIYYSDAVTSGVLQNGRTRSWGLIPPRVPLLQSVPGDLPAGRYLVCVSYVATNGEESGTSQIAAINTSTGGVTIGVTASSEADAFSIRVYVSAVDGRSLYLLGELGNVTTTISYTGPAVLAGPPLTLGMTNPPGGEHLAFYDGRIYMGRGRFVVATEIQRPWLCSQAHSVLPFPDVVTMIAPTNRGIWFGTSEGTYFVEGQDLAGDFKLNRRGNSGVVPGTAAMTDHTVLGLQQVLGTAWIFITREEGLCIGTNDGLFVAPKKGVYKFPKATHGVGCMVTGIDDTYQYLVGLYGAGNTVDVPMMAVNGNGVTTP